MFLEHCTRVLHRLAVVGLLCLSIPSASSGDEVDLRQLFQGPQRCDHVISLLMRYGVNDSSASRDQIPARHRLGSIEIPVSEWGDLQLVSLTRQATISSGCGPTFDVAVKNCSSREVCGVRITLVGLFGRIRPNSPSVTAKIASIPPGEAVVIQLSLPIEALAMGNLNGQPIAFNRLLVAIDSFDQFLESDEANNLRLLDAAAIPVAAEPQPGPQSEPVDHPSPPPAAESGVAVPVASGDPQSATNADSETSEAFPQSQLRSAIDQFSGQPSAD